jgi:hypothetical protein
LFAAERAARSEVEAGSNAGSELSSLLYTLERLRISKMKKLSFCLLAIFLCALAAAAQKVPVQEVVLDNGMRLLLVPRKGDPNVAAGWVARVGSVN